MPTYVASSLDPSIFLEKLVRVLISTSEVLSRDVPLYLSVQGDFEFEDGNNHYGYIAYLAVLVIWEVIPTYLIVVFFRVRMPSASVVSYIILYYVYISHVHNMNWKCRNCDFPIYDKITGLISGPLPSVSH